MIEQLKAIDTDLFLYLNGIHADWMDPIMVFLSGFYSWGMLIVAMLIIAFVRMGLKGVLLVGACIGLSFLLADQSSVQLFKNVFERWRPCHNLNLQSLVHTVDNHCGGRFSFVSSHATNSFSLALFLGYFLGDRKWRLAFLGWAALVAYSRIYLGVHYPADIACGALLGLVCGSMVIVVYRQLVVRVQPQAESNDVLDLPGTS